MGLKLHPAEFCGASRSLCTVALNSSSNSRICGINNSHMGHTFRFANYVNLSLENRGQKLKLANGDEGKYSPISVKF